MTKQLKVSGNGTTSIIAVETIDQGKMLAMTSGWTHDPHVLDFSTFIQVEDFDARIIHEYDAEARRWYEVEMWEGAQP